MKSKTILVSFIAFLAIVFALNIVSASELSVSDMTVVVNDITASESTPTVAGIVSEVVPIDVKFTANEDASDVKVKVYIEGYKDEIYDSTDRFQVINGSRYIKRFKVQLPSSTDLEDLNEELSLLVRISADGKESVEKSYSIRVQKEQYSLNVLSVDLETADEVVAGNSLAVDVVLQNNGAERLDNTYIKVSIPELGVEKRVYFGDLSPYQEDNYEDIRDTTNKRIYLSIPSNAASGIYTIEVEAYNYDTTTKVTGKVLVTNAKTEVMPVTTSKTIAAGEQTNFDVVLVNPNSKMVVYTITPESSTGLLIDVTEPIVTVAADSSKTVKIAVKASANAEEGAHVVKVNIASETGEVKQVAFTVNVEGAKGISVGGNNTVLILTIVLSVVFVVLLIILIVLLTKKPVTNEEFGETSYY